MFDVQLANSNTLPQYQEAEEHWYRSGPELQQENTRFRNYNNPFEAPPDRDRDNIKHIIPLRTVALNNAALASAQITGSGSQSLKLNLNCPAKKQWCLVFATPRNPPSNY